MLAQVITNGVLMGSVIALIASGLAFIYGPLNLVNFAHGDLLMLAAYVVYYSQGIFHMPWPASIVLSVLVTTGLGIVVERAAYRPLRDSPRTTILISAIGVSFLVENLGLVIFGGRPQSFPLPRFLDIGSATEIGGITIENITFLGSIVRVQLKINEHSLFMDTFNNPFLELPRIGDKAKITFSKEAVLILRK